MDKYYTLNELAMFSGLTTRTLRNYLKMNVLSGEKLDGVWMFTEEEVDTFLGNPTVKPSLQAKANALVYDFLLDRKKKNNEICMMLDLCVNDEEAGEISKLFCDGVNQKGGNVQLSFEKSGEQVRVILKGNEETVMELLREYYR